MIDYLLLLLNVYFPQATIETIYIIMLFIVIIYMVIMYIVIPFFNKASNEKAKDALYDLYFKEGYEKGLQDVNDDYNDAISRCDDYAKRIKEQTVNFYNLKSSYIEAVRLYDELQTSLDTDITTNTNDISYTDHLHVTNNVKTTGPIDVDFYKERIIAHMASKLFGYAEIEQEAEIISKTLLQKRK